MKAVSCKVSILPEIIPPICQRMKSPAILFVLLFAVGFSVLLPTAAKADSPLTSTPWFKGYVEAVPLAAAASNGGEMSDEMFRFLTSANEPLVHKLALVNALGWGQNHYDAFLRRLLKGKRWPANVRRALRPGAEDKFITENYQTLLRAINHETLVVAAYLQAMQHYLKPEMLQSAESLVRNVRMDYPKSYAIGLVEVLIKGNRLIGNASNWCRIYQLYENLESSNVIEEDYLNDPASVIVAEYMQLYADSCG